MNTGKTIIKFRNVLTRRMFYLLLHLIPLGAFAQSPDLINYQGAARLQDGTPLDNRSISVKFDIRQGSSSGAIVASETQTLQTNSLGLFSTQIGKTTSLSGINWAGTTVFLQVSIDTSAGSNFSSLGTQQMVSVPYALHASSVPASYANNVLTIGSTTLSVSPTIAVTPNTSLTLSGIGTVTSAGTNTFDINIQAPVITGQNAATVTGAYPNYTVNAATPSLAVTTNSAAAASVNSSGSSFSINIPPPDFTNSGQNIITGTYPNFTVNTPTVPAAITPSIVLSTTAAAGASVSSTGSSFSLNVPPPVFTNSGQNIISGTYPNFTVNTPTVPAAITPSIAVTTTAAAGASVSSTGSSFSINIPPPAFTNTGQSIITGTYPNFSVNTPTVPAAITPSIAVTTTAAAGASVSSTGSSFSINIPPPAFTNTGQNIVTGTYPNFTVNTPTVAATPVTSISPSGIVSVSNPVTNSFVVDVQAPVFTNTGQNIITGTYPNFSVNTPTVPGTSISITSTAAAGPSISVIGTNTFNINIPVANSWNILGNAGTSSVTNFVGTTDNVALMFRVNNQRAGAIDPALSNAFFGSLSGLSNTTGSLNAGFGQSALSSNNSGIMNAALGNRALNANTNGNGNVALGSDALLQNTGGIFNVAAGLNALRGNTTGGQNVALGKDALNINSTGANNISIGYQSGFSSVGSGNVFLGTSAGYSETGSNKFYLANSSTSLTPLMYGDFTTNSIGIGTATPVGNLHVASTLAGVSSRISSSGAPIGLIHSIDATSAALMNAQNTPLNFGTNNTNRMSITAAGNVGINTTAPAALLSVDNQSVLTRNSLQVVGTRDQIGQGLPVYFSASTAGQTFGTNTFGRILRMDNPALGFVDMGIDQAGSFFISKSGNYNPNADFVITGTGNIGMNTSSPVAKLEVASGVRVIANGEGQATFYGYGNGFGGAIKAESNTSGSVGGSIYSQAVLAGIHSNSPPGSYNIGVWGNATGSGSDGWGVVASHGALGSADKYAAFAGPSLAGFFQGNVSIVGSVSKSSGTFKIDHPQDPANKFLYHSFVESPDMMNVYNGNITTDANGDAVVELPAYFEALNIDFRYQLTVMGQFAQAIVSEEVVNNHFKIKTDKPGVKVSWQVTGIRNDAYAKAHRVEPEVLKTDEEKGRYLHPELFGHDKTLQIGTVNPKASSSQLQHQK